MTHRGWALLLALAACGRERTDARLAEVLTPLHVTVRVIDTPVPKNCTGTLKEQVSCLLTRAERQGCVYVELGPGAETPLRSKPSELDRCDYIMPTYRRALTGQPMHKATVYVEPGGERIVVDLVHSLHAVYSYKGQLTEVIPLFAGGTTPPGFIRPDGSVDWSQVPPLLSVVSASKLNDLTADDFDALLAKTPRGQDVLTDVLAVGSSNAGDGWELAFSKLDESHRESARDAMLTAVEQGSDTALKWFMKNKAQRRPDLEQAILSSITNDGYLVGQVLPQLFALDPALAEQAACEQLEVAWHESLQSLNDSEGRPKPDPVLLAVLIERHAKCPWVLPLLLRDPCSWELTCDPDIEDQTETPLCTSEQAQKPLQRALHPDDEEEEEDASEVNPEVDAADDAISDYGALLMICAKQQGPLPALFTFAQQRRLYPATYTFEGEAENDPCRQLTVHVGTLACQLPPAITTTRTEGCRVVIDDVKKRITLSPTGDDAGVLADRLHEAPY